MIRILYLFLGLIIFGEAHSQGGIQWIDNLPSSYVPLDVSYFDRKANESQQRFDANQQKYYQLKNWIANLRTQTNDQQFNNSLSYYERELDALIPRYSGNLAMATRDLNEIQSSISTLIQQYNQAIEYQSRRDTPSLSNLLSSFKAVSYQNYNASADILSESTSCNHTVNLFENGIQFRVVPTK